MTEPDGSATIAWLERLVAFDTTSRNSNIALIDAIAAFLAERGVPHRLSDDPTGTKRNLHAIIGPRVDGGLALSGHVDTVPVDGQSWATDPFRLHRAGGRLTGRGSTDMKGFVAAMLAAVPDIQAMRLARPVHLFITHDEETTGEGARRLAAEVPDGPRPAWCIVGEPTSLVPVIAGKHYLPCTVAVRGRPGHSSRPGQGVNAVMAAAEAVAWLAAEARRLSREGRSLPGFDPGTTTVHVGPFHGGTVLNMIPESAEFRFEVRALPGEDAGEVVARLRAHVAAAIEPAMHAVDPATGFDFDIAPGLPGFRTPADHPLVALVGRAARSNEVAHVAYGTEAGVFEAAGMSVVVCGPGDIAQAHQPDEWIAESQLAACDGFLRRAVALACAA